MTGLGYVAIGMLTFVAIGRLHGDDITSLQIALGIALVLAVLEVGQQLAHLVRVQRQAPTPLDERTRS